MRSGRSPLRSLTLASTFGLAAGCFEPGANDEDTATDGPATSGTADSTGTSASSESGASASSVTSSESGTSPVCGDGELEAPEECDDGNLIDQDGCRANCTSYRCGDGVFSIGWELCDDGNADNTDECTNDCRLPRCGDGFVYPPEEDCDDGNREDGDECPSLCVFGDSTSASETSDTMGSDESGESSGGPTECPDPANPILLDGACVPCDDAPDPNTACAERSSDEPVCVDGSCHACGPDDIGTCSGENPVCGPDNTCVPCSFHDECPESACHIAEGRCFSPGAVMHVDQAAETCPGTGAATLPYCDFSSALSRTPAAGEGVIILGPSGGAFIEQTIDSDRTIAIIDPHQASRFESGNFYSFSILNSVLYLDGVTVASNGGGVQINGEAAHLFLDRAHVEAQSEAMNVANGARATIRNTLLYSESSSGLVVSSYSSTSSSTQITYSTIVNGVRCPDDSAVAIRNSMVITEEGGASAVGCTGADVTFSALSTSFPGSGNVEIGHFAPQGQADEPLEWLQRMGDAYEPDYFKFRLTPQGANLVDDVARWAPGDPTVDVDGQPRPAADGSIDYASHDVPG